MRNLRKDNERMNAWRKMKRNGKMRVWLNSDGKYENAWRKRKKTLNGRRMNRMRKGNSLKRERTTTSMRAVRERTIAMRKGIDGKRNWNGKK